MTDNGLGLRGLWHVALYVAGPQFDATVKFYRDVVGMNVDWQPDPDNVYLTSGHDNLALHRARGDDAVHDTRLDHIGFVIDSPTNVRRWYERVKTTTGLGVEVIRPVKRHRDGATSFYARDPAGNTVQFLHIPALDPEPA